MHLNNIKIWNRSKMISAALIIILGLTGCSNTTTFGSQATNETEMQDDSLTYIADFYDNTGGRWFSVEGKVFSINPNKIKTYSWDSSGAWIYSYEMSSIMSITIDGKQIESCGSTVIFADSRLEKCDIDFEEAVITQEAGEEYDSQITQPSEIRFDDWWQISLWWRTKNLDNKNRNTRLVIIQSQLGNPICVYSGNEVSWDIPSNLPKTTRIIIDGKTLYIHRSNFSIIDTALIEAEWSEVE